MKKIYLMGLFVSLLNAVSVAPAIAESKNLDIDVAASFGSNGLNISAARSINDYVGARLNISTGSEVSRSGELNDNDYEVKFTPKTNGLLLDIAPFAGNFHITAGLMQQDIELSLSGKVGQQYEFNGTTYNLGTNLQAIEGSVDFDRSSAPYLGVSWSNRYKKVDGFTYSFDLGVLQVGSPETNISVTCVDPSGNPNFCSDLQNDIDVETNEINNDISDGDLFYPIITLGFGYSF